MQDLAIALSASNSVGGLHCEAGDCACALNGEQPVHSCATRLTESKANLEREQ
jgi:hypothetical protein